MITKKNSLYFVGTILIVVVGVVFLLLNSGSASVKIGGNAISENEDIQIVKLSVQNGNYVLEPSELRKGTRVRLEADMTKMPGCSRSIVIPAFGVSKTFTTGDNAVEFTPTKAGRFNIACSMNMYKGTFSVLESDGSKSDYVEAKPAASDGGCGMGGGGCGCGGY
jgi:plastocyanin domain-containing protein